MLQFERIALISDLHLSPNTPDLLSLLANALRRQAENFDALFILGDLFDAWIGDDILDNDLKFNHITQIFAQLSQHDKQVFLLHGNRDFLIGEKFAKKANITLLPEQITVNFAGSRVLLCHGDELCTDDISYQQFRTLTRNPAWQQQMLAQPIATRIQLASQLRGESMNAKANKTMDIMDVNQQAVQAALDAAQVQIMIHGHTHRPDTHTWEYNNQSYQRWVLADWQSGEKPQAEMLLITTKGWERISLTQ